MPTPSRSPAEALRRASALMHTNPASAADAFAALAVEAERARNRRRTANTHALAALAFVAARNPNSAFTHASPALDEFFDLRLYHRAPAFYQELLKAAEAQKLVKLADALRMKFSNKIVVFAAEARKDPLPNATLPSECPGCGIAMQPDVVDWITDARAECDFCGTVMDAR
jgi:hypothetical protein